MLFFTFVALCLISNLENCETGLIHKDSTFHPRIAEELIDEKLRSHARSKRYLGLNRRYKINRRYQECVAPGDVPGHCKHVPFCAMNVIGSSRGSLDYLCVITKMHVGVCCPDDIVLSSLTGSRIVMDLPAGGHDYDDEQEASTSGCGIPSEVRLGTNTPAKPSGHIDWPWLAALYRPTGAQVQFCGGAVITDQHILTAAHCVDGMSPSGVRVRLGEYDFRSPDETRARDFGVTEIVPHKEFDPATYFNDIAILSLDKPTNFDTYIWPICLPPVNRTYVNEIAVVAGWGQQYYAGPTSEVLMEVAVPVWDQKMCVEAFAQRITENNLCAAAYEGGRDACLGDSGGPLLYKLENGRWITIGIVSWGIGCGNKDQPGIYTRVDKYIPWIITNTITKQLVQLP